MWSSRKSIHVAVVMMTFISGVVDAADVCPARKGHSVRYLTIYDGLPEELASLEAEETGRKTGYWELGYIFDAGRVVTIRCHYEDRFMIDMKLTKRVERCDFKFDNKQHLILNCK